MMEAARRYFEPYGLKPGGAGFGDYSIDTSGSDGMARPFDLAIERAFGLLKVWPLDASF